MHSIKKIGLVFMAILPAIILFSCTKELEFKGNLLDPKLVVNAICSLDSSIVVEVSTNIPIPGYQTDYPIITDAKVILFVDGIETEQLVYKIPVDSTSTNGNLPEISAYYTGKTVVEGSRKYKIQVSHSAFKTATTGEMQIGKRVPILGITTTIDSLIDNLFDYDTRIRASVRFADPADEENYYRLDIGYRIGKSYFYPNSNGDTVNLVQVMDYFGYKSIESDDPVLSATNNVDNLIFESSNSQYTLFSDQLFNGKTYDLNFFVGKSVGYNLLKANYSNGDFIVVSVELQTLTKDAFLYLKSIGEFDAFSGGVLTEPIQVYNNVTDGLGILGGYSSSVYRLQRGLYPKEGVEYTYGWGSF